MRGTYLAGHFILLKNVDGGVPMFKRDAVLEEQYFHKVSAEFDNQVAACRVAESLKLAGIPLEQIRIVRPNDPNIARKIEPEAHGIAQALFSKYVMLGLIGLVFGLTIAAVLVAMGLAVVRSSSVMTFIALGLLYPVVAVLLAGAVSLRPDHDLLIEKTRIPSDTGLWGVVAHCSTREQQELVKITIGSSEQTL